MMLKLTSKLIHRLHIYVGLLISPLLIIVSFTGLLYIITPSIESLLYKDALFHSTEGKHIFLKNQIEAAQGAVSPDLTLSAVRPSREPGVNTRVLFNDPNLTNGQRQTVFVNPVTAEVKGILPSYGTSGILELRTWLDHLHRSLHIGENGRWYSELAASWLWLISLSGLFIWLKRKLSFSAKHSQTKHHTLGVLFLLGFLFFSATGLTWSKYTGENIAKLRVDLGWETPSIVRTLPVVKTVNVGEKIEVESNRNHHLDHDHGHHHHDHFNEPVGVLNERSLPVEGLYDLALLTALNNGISASKIEIVHGIENKTAWTVTEIDRKWPTQVDAISLDPISGLVYDHVKFEDYSFPAKFTRWGIDFHMGILFGLANEIILALTATILIYVASTGLYSILKSNRKILFNDSFIFIFKKMGNQEKMLILSTILLPTLLMPVFALSLVLMVIFDHYIYTIKKGFV